MVADDNNHREKPEVRVLLISVVFLLSLSLSAQPYNRERTRSVYCQYDFEAERLDAPAPKGYKPFYISHYGRHGARYIYNDSEYELLYDVFSRADSAGVLSPLGEELYRRFMSLWPHFHGRAGELTQYGQMQHRKLAARYLKDYPQIFRRGAGVNAVTSTYSRCIMSMNAFCDVLRIQGVDVYEVVDGRNMAYLAPYTKHNPKFNGEDQSWRSEFTSYFDSRFDRNAFYGRIFTDVSFASSIKNDMNFIMTLYYMDGHMAGTEFPETGFGEVFTDAEYALCNEMDNIKFYMRKGWGEGMQGEVNVALGEALMQDILDKAEIAVKKGESVADLRFGHDGAVMTLLAFLRAEGWEKKASGMADIKKVWRSCNVPMASNIRFIFCRRGADVIVKAQHDESDILLPLKSFSGPYYRWEDFKIFYRKLIDDANVILNHDYKL